MLLACLFAPAPVPRPAGGAYLGVEFGPVPNDLTIQLTFVSSPAYAANLTTGDVLVAIDGKKLKTQVELGAVLKKKKPGDEASLLVRRQNEEITVRVKLAPPFRAHLGVSFGLGGTQVISLADYSPAKNAGIRINDTIVAFEGKRVATTEALVARLKEKKAGSVAVLTVLRNGEEVKLRVTLGKRPGY
jgi:S1-C subfamily serine protease